MLLLAVKKADFVNVTRGACCRGRSVTGSKIQYSMYTSSFVDFFTLSLSMG